CVHRNVVLSPLHRKAFGEMHDSSLGHAVHRFGGKRGEPGLGAHIDDASALLPDHDPTGSLAGEKRSLQIDRQVRSKSSSLTFSARLSGASPALLTRMSSRP